jgi:hypothetical protein
MRARQRLAFEPSSARRRARPLRPDRPRPARRAARSAHGPCRPRAGSQARSAWRAGFRAGCPCPPGFAPGRCRAGRRGRCRAPRPAITTSDASPPHRSRIICVAVPARQGEGRVDAALEAIARIGIDLQRAAGQRSGSGPNRPLSRNTSVVSSVSRCAPPMIPAMLSGPVVVRDHHHAGREGVGLVVERSSAARRPRRGGRADRPAPCRRRRRAAGGQRSIGEEVGDIDQRRDRAQPDGAQPVLQPVRRGPVLHAPDHPAMKSGQPSAVSLVDRSRRWGWGSCRAPARARASACRARARPDRGRCRARPARRAGWGVIAMSITGSTLAGSFSASQSTKRSPTGARGQFDDAVMLVRQFHLALGTHHAVALDAADLADLDRGVDAGHVGAGLGDHHGDALAGIGRAADDLFDPRRCRPGRRAAGRHRGAFGPGT